jgi:hypothetical protein
MSTVMLLPLFGAGLLAGGLTTLAGLGGGILLIALLSQFWPPAMVLGLTAPALLVGNASRAVFLARAIRWGIVGRFLVAGLPAAFVGSMLAVRLPERGLHVALALLLLSYVGRELLARRVKEPRPAVGANPWRHVAAGAIAGAVSGLTGGAGFVATPLLNQEGLTPAELVATSATGMAFVHLTKGVGFGLAGVLTPHLGPACAVVTLGVLGGNALAARWLVRMPRELFQRLLLAALGLAAVELLGA